MREESHLDDMRTAIRGDFDRLAERRGGQELMRAPPEEPEPTVDPARQVEPEPPAEREPAAELEPEVEPMPPDEPGVEELPRRSWLARLLGL